MNTQNIDERYLFNRRIEIGAQLKALRIARGLQTTDFETSGLSKHVVENLEAGNFNFKINFLLLYLVTVEGDIKLLLK